MAASNMLFFETIAETQRPSLQFKNHFTLFLGERRLGKCHNAPDRRLFFIGGAGFNSILHN